MMEEEEEEVVEGWRWRRSRRRWKTSMKSCVLVCDFYFEGSSSIICLQFSIYHNSTQETWKKKAKGERRAKKIGKMERWKEWQRMTIKIGC